MPIDNGWNIMSILLVHCMHSHMALRTIVQTLGITLKIQWTIYKCFKWFLINLNFPTLIWIQAWGD
jgi:hypothetical protein